MGSDGDLASGDEMRGDVGALKTGQFSISTNNDGWTY